MNQSNDEEILLSLKEISDVSDEIKRKIKNKIDVKADITMLISILESVTIPRMKSVQ